MNKEQILNEIKEQRHIANSAETTRRELLEAFMQTKAMKDLYETEKAAISRIRHLEIQLQTLGKRNDG